MVHAWNEVTPHAEWSSRAEFSTASSLETGTVLVLGGRIVTQTLPPGAPIAVPIVTVLGDVWRSDDRGGSWRCVNTNASASPGGGWRARSSAAAFLTEAQRIVLIGGSYPTSDGSNTLLNDVWHSDDMGEHWTLVDATVPFAGRIHAMGATARVIIDDARTGRPSAVLVAMGSTQQSPGVLDKLWQSADDGATWRLVASDIARTTWARAVPTMVAGGLDGRTLIIAFGNAANFDAYGPYYSDVWRSRDGGATLALAISQSPATATFPIARVKAALALLVVDAEPGSAATNASVERLFVAGGRVGGIQLNDAWTCDLALKSRGGTCVWRQGAAFPGGKRWGMGAVPVRSAAAGGGEGGAAGTTTLILGGDFTPPTFPISLNATASNAVWRWSLRPLAPNGAGPTNDAPVDRALFAAVAAASFVCAGAAVLGLIVALLLFTAARRRRRAAAASSSKRDGVHLTEHLLEHIAAGADGDGGDDDAAAADAQRVQLQETHFATLAPSTLVAAQRAACRAELRALRASRTRKECRAGMSAIGVLATPRRGARTERARMVRANDLTQQGYLGRGRFGLVSVGWVEGAEGRGGAFVAVKTSACGGSVSGSGRSASEGIAPSPNPNADDPRARMLEGAILRRVAAHPNIIGMVGVLLDAHMLQRLVLELCADSIDDRSLRRTLPQLKRLLAIDAAAQLHLARGVTRGLAHLHAHGVCHRDLKPSNVLVALSPFSPTDDPFGFTVKLADFGHAKLQDPTATTQSEDEVMQVSMAFTAQLGTLAWCAPELYALDDVVRCPESRTRLGGGVDAHTRTMDELQCGDAFAAGLVLFYIFFRTEQRVFPPVDTTQSGAARGHAAQMCALYYGTLDSAYEERMGSLVRDMLRVAGRAESSSALDDAAAKGSATATEAALASVVEDARRVGLITSAVQGLTARSPAERVSAAAALELLDAAHQIDVASMVCGEGEPNSAATAAVHTLLICCGVTHVSFSGVCIAAASYGDGECIVAHVDVVGEESLRDATVQALIAKWGAHVATIALVLPEGDTAVWSTVAARAIDALVEVASRTGAALRTVVATGGGFSLNRRALARLVPPSTALSIRNVIAWPTSPRDTAASAANIFECELHAALAAGLEGSAACSIATIALTSVGEWRGLIASVNKIFEPKFAISSAEEGSAAVAGVEGPDAGGEEPEGRGAVHLEAPFALSASFG